MLYPVWYIISVTALNSVYFFTLTRFMFCYSTVQCLHSERRSDPAGRGSSSTEREDNQAGRCNLRRWSEHRNEEMDRAKRTDRSVIDRIIARLISGAVAILHPTGSAVRIVVRGEIACDESYTSGAYFGTQVVRRGRSSVLPSGTHYSYSICWRVVWGGGDVTWRTVSSITLFLWLKWFH